MTAVNPLKAKLAAGECATCFMVTMPSVAMVQVLASSGVDALIIDMEHGPIDLATAHAMIAATKGTPAVPIVRVPWSEPWLAKPVLDAGAFGINFPMISSAVLARETVRAVRYPPTGGRGWAPSYAPLRWGLSTEEYLRSADREVLNIVTIEEPAAIEALDEILAVPGIDVVVIASFDLSMAMGRPEARILSSAAATRRRSSGSSNCPGRPMAIDRSNEAITTTSMPGTARISSSASIAAGSSMVTMFMTSRSAQRR